MQNKLNESKSSSFLEEAMLPLRQTFLNLLGDRIPERLALRIAPQMNSKIGFHTIYEIMF